MKWISWAQETLDLVEVTLFYKLNLLKIHKFHVNKDLITLRNTYTATYAHSNL